MTEIEKDGKIKRESLSEEHYFQSLLEQGYRAQLLCETELEQVQFDCLALLAQKTERYNKGDSCSIRVEKAQEILAAIIFTLGVQLKTYHSPDDAACIVCKEGVQAVYTQGHKRIVRLVQQAKLCHTALVKHLLETQNAFYADTIVDGIGGFFELYTPEFAAQEIHITADYPVYLKLQPLLGIEFIKQYLEQLYYENLFCIHFSAEDIHHLLCGYDEHYQELLFNLYEPIFASALGCTISGADADCLRMTAASQSALIFRFAGKETAEIEAILLAAFSELSCHLALPDGVRAYGEKSIPQLAGTIRNAAKQGSLNRVFIVPKMPQGAPKLTVSYGEKMEDELYRKVLEEFMQAKTISHKLCLIKEWIHSLADLEDLLLDAQPSEGDILAVLQTLSLNMLAAFSKKYLTCAEWEQAELRSNELFFSNCLKLCIAGLPPEQQEWIRQASATMEIEE